MLLLSMFPFFLAEDIELQIILDAVNYDGPLFLDGYASRVVMLLL